MLKRKFVRGKTATVEHEFVQQTARLENIIVDAPVVAHIPNSSMDSSRIVSFFCRPGRKDSGGKTKMKINNRHGPGLKPQMESTLSFVAEWALQGACVLTSMKA